VLIATHCEDEKIIKANLEKLKKTKAVLEPSDHPVIRDENACYESSLAAIQFAKKYNTRLHILHITTEKELSLFTNLLPLEDKNITAEVCVHHLYFSSDDYARLGNLIKCNPAIKAPHNREALWKALLDDRLDVIATDHAPHTLAEKGMERNENGILMPLKDSSYEKAHAGLPLVQHPVLLMLKYVKEGRISLEKMVEKMSHAVAKCYKIVERGFLKEGYGADAVIVDLHSTTTVTKGNILYKCGFSPLENNTFPAMITHTFVNGCLVYENDAITAKWDESNKGQRLRFNR
jgi:dihydroorotase